jgi:nucleoid-associated protein YgaU
MLTDKYRPVIEAASKIGIKNLQTTDAGGKIKISGTVSFQLDKDQLWDKIKMIGGWDKEVTAEIKVERTDIYGYYTVQPGDTLSKLAKGHLGDPTRYMEIFNLNKNILSAPDLIRVGQKIQLPPK